MGTLNSINTILTQIQTNAAKIGITLAGVMVAVYCIIILVSTDNSPAARAERWGSLKKVFVVAVIIAGTGAFITFAQNIGGMVK